VPHFLRQALRGGTLVVHGDGSQTRDYVYVDDVVSAMVAASTAPNVNGLVINVGSGTETSIRELVKKVEERLAAPWMRSTMQTRLAASPACERTSPWLRRN